MVTLEPCPCCGLPADIKDVRGQKIRQGWVGCTGCGLYIQWKISPDGAIRKWNTRIRITADVFDRSEIFRGCTVQVLTNTATGETSVGWWPAGEEPEVIA